MGRGYYRALGFAGIFAGVELLHFLLMKFINRSEADFMPIYVFTTIVCIITLFLIAEANNLFHQYLGFIFIGIITLKLIAAKMFMNRFDAIDEPVYKFSFIVLYLISLVLITIFAAKLLLKNNN
ncbi:MAG: hypothetical protein WDA08_06320 [Weeksellaceae bacterium]